jgi:hypothetical protein
VREQARPVIGPTQRGRDRRPQDRGRRGAVEWQARGPRSPDRTDKRTVGVTRRSLSVSQYVVGRGPRCTCHRLPRPVRLVPASRHQRTARRHGVGGARPTAALQLHQANRERMTERVRTAGRSSARPKWLPPSRIASVRSRRRRQRLAGDRSAGGRTDGQADSAGSWTMIADRKSIVVGRRCAGRSNGCRPADDGPPDSVASAAAVAGR